MTYRKTTRRLDFSKILIPENPLVAPCKGIRVTEYTNFSLLKSGIEYPESGIHSVESRIYNCLGFPHMGRHFCKQWEPTPV